MIMLNSDYTLYWVNVCFSVFYMIKHGRTIKFTKSLICAFVLLCWEFFHMFIFVVYPFGYSYFVKEFGFMLVLIAVLLFLQKVDIHSEFRGLFAYWVGGLLSACTIFYIKYVMRFGLDKALSFVAGLGKNSDEDVLYLTFYKDPNMISRLCGVSICILLAYLIYNKAYGLKIRRGLCLSSMVALIFFGMVSGAMSLYLMFAVCLVFTFAAICHDLNFKAVFKTVLIGVTGIGISVITVIVLLPNAVNRMIRDLFVHDVSDGRFDLWLGCLRVFQNHPLLALCGVGLQDYHKKMADLFGTTEMLLHNVIFESIASWGIIGTTIFGIMLFCLVKECRGEKKAPAPLVSYVPAVTVFTVFLTGNFFYGYYMNFSFLMIVILSGIYFAKAKERRGVYEG